MKLLRSRQFTALGAWMLALSQLLWTAGCRQSTGGGGGGSGSTAAAASTGVNMGQILYDMLQHTYEKAGETGKMAALESRKSDFIGAVNRILPSDVSSNLFPTLRGLLVLVDDGTVEGAAADMDAMMVDMLAEQPTIEALARLLGGPSTRATPASAVDDRAVNTLISRILAYPEVEEVVRAAAQLVGENDGVDEAGQPNGEQNLCGQLQALASRQLLAFQPSAGTGSSVSSALSSIGDALLTDQPLKAFPDLGAPAWAVRLDVNGNPQVQKDAQGRLLPPFVDGNADGVADVNTSNHPIDAAGAEIHIAAFGKDGARDSHDRALSAGGGPLYVYFDAKRTLVSQVLLLVGELLKKDVTGNVTQVVEALADRQTHDNGTADPTDDYTTLSPDCPILDAQWAGMEVFKRTSLCEVLRGLAAVVKSDPAKFATMLDKLMVAIVKARKAAVAVPAAPAGTGPTLMNDLLPLLEAALQPRGRSVSAVRALLQAFNSEQKRLKTLPRSFALMMKYNDYRNRVLAGPGKPSVMERVLGMMERANTCNVLGGNPSNMADFYLAAMAGNARILGINIGIGTINNLVDISIIRNVLCSAISSDDVRALKDFNDTGALEAMKPICAVFQSRGEISLLKNIMLGLGKHYATAMRPTEPTAVAILESGGVEILFEAIDSTTTIRVPGSTEVVADVSADLLAQLVDGSAQVYDRRNVAHRSLMAMMLAPMDAMSAKCAARNVKPQLDAMTGALADVLFQTYTDNGVEHWKWDALEGALGDLLSAGADIIPVPQADRAAWAFDQQQSFQRAFMSRDTTVVLDVLKTVGASQQKAVFNRAIGNLFTPNPATAQDAFGAITALLACKLTKKPAVASNPIDDQALADVLHFFGRQLDPALNHAQGIIKLVRGLVRADDGLLLLRLARNSFDTGPNGTDETPVAVLQDVFKTVGDAGGPGGGMTAASIRDMLEKAHEFMNDSVDGFPNTIARIKARNSGR